MSDRPDRRADNRLWTAIKRAESSLGLIDDVAASVANSNRRLAAARGLLDETRARKEDGKAPMAESIAGPIRALRQASPSEGAEDSADH